MTLPGSQNRQPRILVADDESRIRLALRSCLEAEGYEVYEAEDGEAALSVIIQHAPDLLILDLAMPVLDGMRTLGMLEGVHGQLKPKVIILTAWGSMPAAMRAIALGAAVFLEKPVLPETLRTVVAQVLDEPAEQGGVGLGWDRNRD